MPVIPDTGGKALALELWADGRRFVRIEVDADEPAVARARARAQEIVLTELANTL
jgi:hypothetical protein